MGFWGELGGALGFGKDTRQQGRKYQSVDPVPYGDEFSAEDVTTWLNYGGNTGFNALRTVSEGAPMFMADGSVRYDSRAKGNINWQQIMGYLQARNQGKQAQEEYIKLLKERPGRTGTILTAGTDPTTAQTIKTVLGEQPKTVLGG